MTRNVEYSDYDNDILCRMCLQPLKNKARADGYRIVGVCCVYAGPNVHSIAWQCLEHAQKLSAITSGALGPENELVHINKFACCEAAL